MKEKEPAYGLSCNHQLFILNKYYLLLFFIPKKKLMVIHILKKEL